MNRALLARYDATLQGLARKHRLRTLSPCAGLDFSSNDYLGLAASRRLGDAVAAAIARGTSLRRDAAHARNQLPQIRERT